jgi:hypothetical protein
MFNWSTESISQTMLSRQFQVVCSKLIMCPKLYPASRRIILFSTYILSRSQLRRGTKGITGCITNSGILQPHTCCISAFFSYPTAQCHPLSCRQGSSFRLLVFQYVSLPHCWHLLSTRSFRYLDSGMIHSRCADYILGIFVIFGSFLTVFLVLY